jgi:hypothetical protein
MKTIVAHPVTQDVLLGRPLNSYMSEDVSPEGEHEATRGRALLETSAEAIQNLDAKGITALQNILQHGSTFGVWYTPTKWSPLRCNAHLNIDLRNRIFHFLSPEHQQIVRGTESCLDHAVLFATRYMVMCRMGPSGMGTKRANRSLDPSGLMSIGYTALPALIAVGVSKWLDDAKIKNSDMSIPLVTSPNSCMRLIRKEDLAQFSSRQQSNMNGELRRMHMLKDKGLWTDVSAFEKNSTKVTGVSGDARRPPQPKITDEHKPLPDNYVSEMGSKSLWIIENFGANLLTIGEAIKEIWERTENPALKPVQVLGLRITELREYLLGFTWLDKSGAPFNKLPFLIKLSASGLNSNKRRNEAKQPAALDGANEADMSDLEANNSLDDDSSLGIIAWPPRHFNHILGLMGTLQCAHLFVVALSIGSRKSEVLTLKRSCVEYAKNGFSYANGRTYKLVERHDGALRDWVLSDVAVQAIEQQIRLVVLAEAIGTQIPKRKKDRTPLPQAKPGTHLWGQISCGTNSDPRKVLLGINPALVRYAQMLGMEIAPGGQSLRSHRFRKTLARIVALALSEAPKVLMNVFGHKNIEMTLYYILTDENLQADIEQVSRELKVMRALNTVQAIVAAEDAQNTILKVATSAGMASDAGARLALGGYGGPAAEMVSNAIKIQKERLHAKGDEWGTEHAQELAMILTLNGKAWQLVRPGVICTKFPGTESGPCNYSVGRPEPSRCRTSCSHRLEEGFLREDVDGSIKDAVEAYKDAGEQGEDLTQEFWVGQILGHLRRFDDLHQKWMQDSTVKKLVDEAQLNSVDTVRS